MEVKINGVNMMLDVATLGDGQITELAQEVADVIQQRGLELPFAVGTAAVEGGVTRQTDADKERRVVTKESFAEQLPIALQGYQATVGALNHQHIDDPVPLATDETIAAEFEAWLTDDKLAYVSAIQEANPASSFTLVATPNVTVSPEGLIQAATAFHEGQPGKISVKEDLYSASTPEQLSGTNPDNGSAVIFSLIPSADDMKGLVPKELRYKLSASQAAYPFLKVPSPLETIAYWQTLRAGSDYLADEDAYRKTHIIHFNLPEREFEGYAGRPYFQVPSMFIAEGNKYLDSEGGIFLGHSRADDMSIACARVAVG